MKSKEILKLMLSDKAEDRQEAFRVICYNLLSVESFMIDFIKHKENSLGTGAPFKLKDFFYFEVQFKKVERPPSLRIQVEKAISLHYKGFDSIMTFLY